MPDALKDGQEWINHGINISTFRNEIIVWGKRNFRSFPWRQTIDPYQILIAEVMLHRTQVSQVLPVYEIFINQYPDLIHLVQANKDDLKISLQSLGLHWRINLVFQMGELIAKRFGSQVPREKEDLLSLPGISEYISSAVRCFAWNLPEPLIDTNTVRIIGRVFGWEIKESSRRSGRFRKALAALVDKDEPRAYNYALLDLAHLVCMKKQKPLCHQCPILFLCNFGQSARPL